MNAEKKAWLKTDMLAYGFCLLLIWGVASFLFWAQSRGLGGRYISDMIPHIRFIEKSEGTYTLETPIFKWLYEISGHLSSIALFLGLLIMLTPVSCYILMRGLDRIAEPNGKVKTDGSKWAVLGLIFMQPAYIPILSPVFFKGSFSMNAWHNSTYNEMRIFCVLALAIYFVLEKEYLSVERICVKRHIAFSILLFIGTWFKPSFFLGFAPVMLISLIADFFVSSKNMENLRRIFCLGLTAIPSGLIVFMQYYKSFVEDTGTNLKVGIQFDGVSFCTRFIISLGCPLLVFLYNIRGSLMSKRNVLQIWGLWVIEFLYSIIFMETGERAGHGNFGWGIYIATFIIMIAAVRLFLNNAMDIVQRIRAKAVSRKEMGYLIIVGVYWMYQLVCGLIYFAIILRGGFYYC